MAELVHKIAFRPILQTRLISSNSPYLVELISSNSPLTQAVEQAVKITTEAASKVVGFEQRHGMICQRIKARKLIPKFHSKKDALPLLEKS